MKTNKTKKNTFLTKKTTLLTVVGLAVLLGIGFFTKFNVDLSASVLNLSQIARNRKASFSAAPKEILPTICIDSDGGIDYTTKGTIFLSGGINRMEEDSCNTNGTLREWFCGQPGDAAGLLRSENYVDCEYGCNDGACNPTPTTGNIIKDLAIENGYFIASNDHQATFSITVKNIGNISLPISGIGHELYLDGISTLPTDNYNLEFLTAPSLSSLESNDTYTISATITLDEDLTFSYSDTLHVDIPTYPETDENIANNATILYITGQIVDCNSPENILNCSLGLSSCPAGCSGYINTGIGDIIIEDMFISPNPVATLELTNVINKVNLKVKNIGSGNIIIPYANSAQRLSLGCYEAGRGGGTLTIPIGQTILAPNETITTQLYNTSNHRFSSIGQKSLTCTIDSQQEGSRSSPDANNTGTIYESNGQNNSFTLNYMVSGTLELPQGDLIIEDMYITPDNTPVIGTDTSTNIFNLVIKNIGSGDITIPTNTYTKMGLICYYNVGHGGFHTLPLNINTIAPNQSITTQIEILNPAVDPGWFDTLGPKYMQCIITSQQQQLWASPDPNNQYMIYETDGTNNSFTLDYEVVSSKTTQTLRDKLRK